jgi:hypothetical protein
MVTSEYDLLVARDRFIELREEMRAINLAQRAKTEAGQQPSILDRVFSLFNRGAHVQAPSRKVGAAA